MAFVCVERRGQKICAKGRSKAAARAKLRRGTDVIRLRASASGATKSKRRAAGKRLQRDYRCTRAKRSGGGYRKGQITSCRPR